MAEASTDFHSSCDSNDRSARQSIGCSKVDLIQDDAVAELEPRMCEPVDESARDDHREPTRSDESQSWKRERADSCKRRSDEVAQSYARKSKRKNNGNGTNWIGPTPKCRVRPPAAEGVSLHRLMR